jgi:hypothetical protein
LALTHWETTVESLETSGYPLSDDDYFYELHLRGGLERILRAVPSIRERVDPLLNSLDERFVRATRPTVKPLGGTVKDRKSVPMNEVEWWYFRYPRKFGPELTEQGFRRGDVELLEDE